MPFHQLERCAAYPYTRSEYLRRFLWEWVQATFIRFSPRRAYGWRRFWLRRFGATIGQNAGIKATTKVVHPWLLSIGDFTILSDNVVVYNLGPVKFGRHSVVSQDVYICAGTHDYTRPDLPLLRPGVTVGDGVWVCAGAFLGPGVTVGHNSVVGARAVVSRDVPEGVVVAGNPARVVKERPMQVDAAPSSPSGPG